MKKIVEDPNFSEEYKSADKNFTRNRKWTFSRLFFFISCVISKRLQSEIDNYFAEIFQANIPNRFASSASFTKARKKIKEEAFRFVSDQLIQKFYTDFNLQKFYGYRILAVDGSIYTLPRTKETIKEFGENVFSKDKTWVKAQVSHLADVVNNVVIDHKVAAYKACERILALNHFKHCGNGDITVFDRGYWSKDIMEQIYETDSKFCFRVKSNCCKIVMNFVESAETDIITEFKTNKYLIKVRLTKIELDSGETEYLLTNLTDEKRFTIPILKKLYQLRWGIEEQYKDLKYALVIENFSGKSVQAILQDINAKILMYNLTIMSFKTMVEKKVKLKKRKYEYKLNKRAALSKVVEFFIPLITNAEKIMDNLILMLTQECVPVRPNRKQKRKATYKAKPKPIRQYISAV